MAETRDLTIWISGKIVLSRGSRQCESLNV